MELETQFQRVLKGEPLRLEGDAFTKLKVHCSNTFTSLQQWTDLAIHLYHVDAAQCLDLLLYVEKHELSRPAYREYSNNPLKIHILNSLAALYLCRDNKVSSVEDKGKLFDMAKKYIFLAEKVKAPAGKTSLTVRAFAYFYEGSFAHSVAIFSKAAQFSPGDEEPQSVIGMLGLAQVFFAKRNYEGALAQYKKALKLNKALPTKARLGMAYCFYELEKYELAKLCFKRLLDLQPHCIEAILGYATLGFHEGFKDQYFRAVEKCYQLDPTNPLVLLHLAEHMLMGGSSVNLVAVISKGQEQLRKLPTFLDKNDEFRNDQVVMKCKFHHLLGEMFHQEGEYESCLKQYNLAINKNLPYVKMNLAQVYINSSNFVEASKHMEEVFANVPLRYRRLLSESFKTLAYIKSKITIKKDRSEMVESIQHYTEALKYNKKDYESYIECANVLLETDPKKSEQYYREAYQILKEQGKFIHPELLNNIGVLKAQKKEETQAEEFMKLALRQVEEWFQESMEEEQLKLIKKKAFLVTFYFNLGVLYEESFRYQESAECYNKAIQANPLYVDVYVRQAFLAAKKGEYDFALQRCTQAEQVCDSAKSKYINKDKIILTKSYIYKMIGDQRKAREVLKDAHNEPYKKILDQSLEYELMISRGDSNTRNLKEILKQRVRPALKILEEDPNNMYGLLYFGVLAATLEKPREAMLCLNALKQLDNQHPKVLLNLGIYNFKAEEYDTALMLLKKYVDKAPIGGDFTGDLTICFILMLKQRYEEAIRNIKRLVIMHPESLMLRYHLAFFIQRASEKHLDSENREPKKISKAIAYIRRIKTIYAFFSRMKADQYLNHIVNNEAKEKLREELNKIREKSDDQKMYIKSREDRFSFYERDAENKERAIVEEKTRLMNKAKEVRERQQRMLVEEERLKEVEAQTRREVLRRQKELEERLNQEYREELEMRTKGKEPRKHKESKGQRRTKRRREDSPSEDEFVEPDDKDGKDDNTIPKHEKKRSQPVDAPKEMEEEQAPKKHRRLKRKTEMQEQDKESSDDRVEEKNDSVKSVDGSQKMEDENRNEDGDGNGNGNGNGNEDGNEDGNEVVKKRKGVESDDEFLNQLEKDEE